MKLEYAQDVTVETLMMLHEAGFEFEINDGAIVGMSETDGE